MDKLFERTLSLNDFSSSLKGNPTFLITSYNGDITSIRKVIGDVQTIAIKHSEDFSSSSTTSADIIDRIEVFLNGKKDINCTIENIDDYLINILPEGSTILINITDFGTRAMAILLSNIKYVIQKRTDLRGVFCGYAEPKAYRRRGIDADSNYGNQSQFDLYSCFAPTSPLPNLNSVGSDDSKQLWIVLLGFEGYRTDTVIDEIPRIDDIVALITMPSMRLGWSNYAFCENAHFLRGVDQRVPTISGISATSPFSVYNTLYDLQTRYHDFRLQISPFSTKANSLGVLLYALNNSECSVVFDNPLESSRAREDHSDIYHVYDITEPLKRGVK